MAAVELVFAHDGSAEAGQQEFHMLFACEGDETPEPGEATLTMDDAVWDALGKPGTIHAYNAEK